MSALSRWMHAGNAALRSGHPPGAIEPGCGRVLKGVTQTCSIGEHHLPVRVMLRVDGYTTVAQYARYDVPVSIQVPAA